MVQNPKEIDNLGDIGIEGSIILKNYFDETL
jgi:hypothetical protein